MSEPKPSPSRLSREEIQRLQEKDHTYLWHPFTPMEEWIGQDCLIITGGDGSYLIDAEGNRYLDGVSSLWVNLHGHRRKEIDDAVRDQLDRIAHSTLLGLSHEPAIELAEKLVRLTPEGLTRVFYSDSGSTAVEAALKIAFQFWSQHPDPDRHAKRRIVSFHNAYHGDTLGAVSVGGMDTFHRCYGPLLFAGLKVHYPYCYRCHLELTHPGCGLACMEELEDLLERQAHTVAALIIEPLVQGAAGMITAPEGFLKGVETLCRKHEVLLIADEVAVGWGRTGSLFAVEREGVRPDLMALAKGITGGYLPLAATLATETIYQGFLGKVEEGRTFFHGHTYTGNPLAARAALAALDLFEKDRTLQTLPDKVRRMEEGLRPFRALEHVGDVRQCGFLAGIELVEDRATRRPYPPGERIGMRVAMEARKHGLVIRPLGDVMVIMPPLILTSEEIDRLLEITLMCIREITESGER